MADSDGRRSRVVEMNAYYRDQDFPKDSSLIYDFNNDTCKDNDKVTWIRAKKLHKNPRFIVEGVNYHDLDQGELGDCWFIAAAATLAATQRQLFQNVVPPHQDFDRKFHFKFWSYGKWQTVEVDDFLPTKNCQLIYTRNMKPENEFWPSLLEKAYAKLWYSYERLEGGFFNDAMVDLTGGISESIMMSDKENSKKYSNLFHRLLRCSQMRSLLGAFIDVKENRPMQLNNGLIQRHVYSIVSIKELNFEDHGDHVRLLRLRNPWGHAEWRGAWSDHSTEMRRFGERFKDLQIDKRDEGEFWITFEDLVDNFDRIDLCHLQADAILEEPVDHRTLQEWHVNVYHDTWVPGDTSDKISSHLYWNNPQFYLELKTAESEPLTGTCSVIISLMKKERLKRGENYIAFNIYKTKQAERRRLSNRNEQELVQQARVTYVSGRENTKRFELPPGHYVIIPSTKERVVGESENNFLLRIFTESPAVSWAMTGQDEEKTEDDHKVEEEDHKEEKADSNDKSKETVKFCHCC